MTFLEQAEEFVNYQIDHGGGITIEQMLMVKKFADSLDEWIPYHAGDAFILHKRKDGDLELIENVGEDGE